MIPLITAMLIFAFAIIILAVSLIVIRFGIINNIEQNMSNIGVLKAAGFKSNQITASIIWQFCSTAIVGSLLGIVAAHFVLPIVSSALETQSALIWNTEIYYVKAAISLISVFVLVFIVSFMATKRVNKLHPLIALRGGIQTHNFKKNHLPLEKSRGPLSLLLAAKVFLKSKRQGLMIAFIVAFLSFASIVSISLYYNVGVEKDAFAHMIAGEVPDAAFILKDSKNSEEVANRLRERDDVRKIFGYQNVSMMVYDTEVQTIVSDDFSQFEGTMLHEGRYPKHDNEVAISNNVATDSGKDVGETILVKQGTETKEFVITGLIQLMNNGGFCIAMPYDGVLTLQEDFQFSQIYIYLTDGTDAKAFINNMINSEGDIFSTTVEMGELMDAQLSQYGDIFAMVAAIILIIIVIVVVLVLYLVIKTMILRRKRDFGIQKAVGFTTIQLMNQVALNYTPLIIIGIGIGSIAGYFSMNPLMSALLKSVGVMNANMTSPLNWTILTSIILITLAYLVSMLVSWRIRKISAYSLISE